MEQQWRHRIVYVQREQVARPDGRGRHVLIFAEAPRPAKAEGGFQTFLFGPRLNLRRDHFVPFVEFLVGDFRADGQVTGGARQSSFALAAGGGVDVVFTKHIAWRFAQIDYLMTNANGVNLNAERASEQPSA